MAHPTLLVDEVSFLLASAAVDRLFETLQQIALETQLTVLFVVHHVDLALRYADRDDVMAESEIVTHDPAANRAERRDEIGESYSGVAL